MIARTLQFLIEQVSTSEPSYFLHQVISFFKPLSNLIKDTFTWLFHDTMNRNIDKILYIIGIFTLARYTLRGIYHLRWLFKHSLGFIHFNPTAFKNQYGQNSYILVTGFTEGIGLAFACEFAKLRFNLALVGRNKVKIENALAIIKKINSDIDVKVIEVDFSSPEYVIKNTIEDETRNLDVSILINNVGFATKGDYYLESRGNILKVIKTNVNSMVVLNKLFVPRFKLRRDRSGIINLSSCTGVFPAAFLSIYPATKVYIDVASRIMEQECKDYNIDVLTYRPFGVTTPMMSQKHGKLMITPKQCAVTAIHQLGVLSCSYGGYYHKLSGEVFESMTEEQRLQAYVKYKF